MLPFGRMTRQCAPKPVRGVRNEINADSGALTITNPGKRRSKKSMRRAVVRGSSCERCGRTPIPEGTSVRRIASRATR